MNGCCPKSIFRYFGHPLWPEERPLENPAFRLLETLTLKVSSPSEFNDPFEFSPVFDASVSKPEARVRLGSMLNADARKRGLPSKFAEDLADAVLSLKQGQDDRNFIAQQTVLPTLSEHYGVVCFSAVDDHPLMWAHYAAQHFGVMIELDTTVPLFRSFTFVQVDYQSDRAKIVPGPNCEFQHIVALASRKSPAWDYEKEYRLIVPLSMTRKLKSGNRDIHLLDIESTWIKSVTVGLRASIETKAEVNKLIRRPDLAHLHPQRYRMVMHAKTYQLVRERVDHF